MPVTIDVQKLRVRSLDVDYNEISWEIASTSEDIFDYTFQLIRSEGAEGPYEPISPEMDDQYYFIDNNIKRSHIYRQYFYRLIVKNKSDGSTKEFGPVSKEADPDLIATEIRKHMNLLFREFAGRRCWIFPVRTFGNRCTCFNSTLGKRNKSGCVLCYDQGFVKGFMRPIETWVQIDPTSKGEQNTNVGPLQQETTTARLGFYPSLKPRDLLIEGENARWRVMQVNSTEQSRSALHQEIQIHRIPPTDIEYKLEFDPNLGIALKDIFFSPSRNFTNPQTLENFKNEEIPNIFGLYPSTYSQVKT